MKTQIFFNNPTAFEIRVSTLPAGPSFVGRYRIYRDVEEVFFDLKKWGVFVLVVLKNLGDLRTIRIRDFSVLVICIKPEVDRSGFFIYQKK